jgi:hypothetical protein
MIALADLVYSDAALALHAGGQVPRSAIGRLHLLGASVVLLKANRRSSLSNPWLSLWMSAANSWAGAARGFWTAEMHRQQSAMMNEMIRQTVRFWTRTWTVSIADHKSKRR